MACGETGGGLPGAGSSSISPPLGCSVRIGCVDFSCGAVPGGCSAAGSSVARTVPLATLSPTLTLTSRMVPAWSLGTSMVALSLSSVTSDCSTAMVSPGFISTSMTATSSKSPMSGIFSSMVSAMCGFLAVWP
jgi:hypothetical protein